MADVTIIGRSARVRGRVTGASDLEIQGFVEGEVTIDGDVLVDDGGKVGATIRGRVVTIRGAVRGDVHGEDAVRLESGARVVGEVRAPRVAIAVGAKLRGFVQTSGAASGSAPARTTAKARVETRASAPASAPHAGKAAPASTPAPGPVAAAVHGRREERLVTPPASRPVQHTPAPVVRSALAGGRSGPPAPTVPVLKKAKGQLAKKRGE